MYYYGFEVLKFDFPISLTTSRKLRRCLFRSNFKKMYNRQPPQDKAEKLMAGIFSILRSVGSKITRSYPDVEANLNYVEQRFYYGRASDHISPHDLEQYEDIVQQVFDDDIDPEDIDLTGW